MDRRPFKIRLQMDDAAEVKLDAQPDSSPGFIFEDMMTNFA